MKRFILIGMLAAFAVGTYAASEVKEPPKFDYQPPTIGFDVVEFAPMSCAAQDFATYSVVASYEMLAPVTYVQLAPVSLPGNASLAILPFGLHRASNDIGIDKFRQRGVFGKRFNTKSFNSTGGYARTTIAHNVPPNIKALCYRPIKYKMLT